ncbi:bifunctional ligase/repressor BirA [Paenibacillus sp. J45TS6]|uniref:biotin--[acetyl-CoA-carboxylase] ligase n=1 Tax=unclassified Paenibacillus TaxID=185978 RepID=UPI001B1977EA|nr:biotin--[acetyl-CoA-carboxylase] ligase [Paenibacillus sp. J45TS6]GIP41633.1 bifunctional ligase/repressor BirA [Paenibacillus sp. J45TS6]
MKFKLLLDLFDEKSNSFVSGEEISNRLSISRAAVWKQINQLRELGYEFEAVSRKGYRLLYKPDKYEHKDLMQNINTAVFGSRFHLLESTSSTQIEAIKLAEEGAEAGTLVISDMQTSGRGRLGRNWFSPAGKGIWMSLVLRPELPVRFMPQLTLLTGVAVCSAIRKVTGVEAGLKWPNDILISGRKVCGILLEAATEDNKVRYCIAGIGIDVNLSEQDYPEELRSIATSLRMESGTSVSRSKLIGEVMNELEARYLQYEKEGFAPILKEWEALSASLGKQVRSVTLNQVIEGTAIGLSDSGGLIVLTEEGKNSTIFSGEVEIIQ